MTRDSIYILIIVIVAFAAFHFYEVSENQKMQKENARAILREKTDSIQYWRNQHGEMVSQKAAAEITHKEFEDHYADLAKEMEDRFDIATKNLKAVVQAEFQALGEGTTVIHNHYDSISGEVRESTFSIADAYLALDAAIDWGTNEVKYNYTYTDTLTYAFHLDKKWVFGKEQLYGSGSLRNKNARVTSATSVLINDYKDKRWCVTVGVSYLPFLQADDQWSRLQASVGVGYALIKW